MRYTMLADTDGFIYCTVPHVEDSKEHVRLGRIEKRGIANFAVAFQVEGLKVYDKAKFITYADAVNYEQEVLDAHMADIFDEIRGLFAG